MMRSSPGPMIPEKPQNYLTRFASILIAARDGVDRIILDRKAEGSSFSSPRLIPAVEEMLALARKGSSWTTYPTTPEYEAYDTLTKALRLPRRHFAKNRKRFFRMRNVLLKLKEPHLVAGEEEMKDLRELRDLLHKLYEAAENGLPQSY